MWDKAQFAQEHLEQAMAEKSYQLNSSKTVNMPFVYGVGTVARTRLLLGLGAMRRGRYLGPELDANGLPTHEVLRRCRGAKLAYRIVSNKVWHAPIPKRLKRTLLISFVHGSLLTGMESFVLQGHHFRQMDKTLGALLGRALACKGTQGGGGQAHHPGH